MKDKTNPWLDSWKKHKELGRGGQGIITELRHKTNTRRRAVLKQIVPRWREDPQARQRLRQEAETLLKLHDLGAFVPKVYDSFLNHKTAKPFILMEFIKGIRFDEWLKTSISTTPAEAVLITRSIAKTISLCHHHEIGHRDLKPANIILKDGKVDLPYVLDFGIAFDSRQSVILTNEGEMFWNEFLILPEYQDLEGGHRDLRSDITALAGIFFSCLTGRPPIVLRDAQDLSPHQRHEKLLLDSAEDEIQGEYLLQFFNKAFAYRINDRFKTLDEFTGELARFADSSSLPDLDPVEQFANLDKKLQLTDRNMQIIALEKKYKRILDIVWSKLQDELNTLHKYEGNLSVQNIRIDKLNDISRPIVLTGDILGGGNVSAFKVGRANFRLMAVALLAAFGVGMQVHIYTTSYTTQSENNAVPSLPLNWVKIAVYDENTKVTSESKKSVIIKNLKTKLAHEIMKLF